MPSGNDGSVFVEALVSRSGDDGDNYEVQEHCLFSVFNSTTCVDNLHCGILLNYLDIPKSVVGRIQFHVTGLE